MGRAILRGLIFALLVLAGAGARAQDDREASLLATRALDQRVAAVGHRLAVGARDLCRDPVNRPGFTLHDLSQYGADFRAAASRAFGLGGGPGVLALVPGGPAERAGLRLDDVVLSLDGMPLPRGEPPRGRSFERMAQILDALDAAFADGAADAQIRRAGAPVTLHLGSEPGCASRFQLLLERGMNARADGRYVQVTVPLVSYAADDAELAAVLAHEFAHNLLGHRVRLDQAGVSRGVFANFGRNARTIRETEVEADRMSVYLMERAGYDPQAAVRFWARFGRRGLNFLGSPTHPNWRRRVALLEAEIAAIRSVRAAGRVPVPPIGR